MGLGIDAKSKGLSIAMIVLGLAYLLVFILQMKYGIKLLLVPHGMILIGYIIVTILLSLHYVNLSKPESECNYEKFNFCDHELRYISVLNIGLISSFIMIIVFIILLNKMVLHIQDLV